MSNNQEREQKYGEGNYEAGREYQEAVSKSAGTERSKRAAERAKQAMSSSERSALEAAERAGKAPAKGVPEK